MALKALGKIDLAILNYDRAIALNSKDEKTHFNRANALVELGKFDEAIVSYRTSIRLNPSYAEAHGNLGNALCKTDKTQDAIDNYDIAISLKPDYVEAYSNRGIALMEMNRPDEALASYEKAAHIRPDYADSHYNRGNALRELDRLDEALAAYHKAISLKPDYADAYINRGTVLSELNRLEEALGSYLKAISLKPDHAGAYVGLCQFYEKQNNLGEFEKAIEKAVRNCGENNSDILFCRAQLANRKNHFEVAIGYLDKVQVQKLQPSLKEAYFSVLGKACDNLEQFERAFSAFEKQNELTKISGRAQKFNADKFLNSIQLRKEAWTTDVKATWPNSMIGVNQTSPAFIIGFPRSGTTLLDTILRSHPGISVVEEMPMVRKMSKAFGRMQSIQNFNALSVADVLGLRDVYATELKMHLNQGDDGKLIVDKLPLNVVHVGLIHRVFTDAKFILVLHHPCDCVLSCFMQTFKLNDAMANFLNLDQSARLYAAVMELWSLHRQNLNLDVHVLKYEDLIQDLEGTCRSLIKFLGVEWDDNIYSYQKTALSRAMIRTPSYSQVIQPLYKQASGRWTNYQKQMQHVLPVLRPWIDAFGY